MSNTRNPPADPPGSPDQLLTVARRYHQSGRLAEAAAIYAQALVLAPDRAEIHGALADVLANLGQFDQAQVHYRLAISLNPGLARAHHNLATLFSQRGDLEKAAAGYRQALAVRPDYSEAHYNLGNVLRQQGRLSDAEACYRQALALRPDYTPAQTNLGIVLLGQRRFDEAAAIFQSVLAARPGDAEAHYNLAGALRDQGHVEEAVAGYRQALALRADYVDARNNLANLLMDLGRFDEALEHYQQLLAHDPHVVEAHFNRADLKTFQRNDQDLAVLESLIGRQSPVPENKQAYVHFALAKARDDIGDYDRAFQHWIQGNALKRREIAYDARRYEEMLHEVEAALGPETFDRFAGAGNPSPTPIFILGMPRSGSSLVEQILASHPAVYGGGELAALDELAQSQLPRSRTNDRYPHYLSRLGAAELRQLGDVYLASLPELPPGKSRVTDKTPQNFWYLGLIRLILPGARIIHTLRDPRDTCLSCFSKLFAAGQHFSYDLGELGQYFRMYDELMEHWRTVLPEGAVLEVRYEEVVDNLEEQSRRLLEFCGLPWDERCLRFHETRRFVATASAVQVRRPIYHDSIGRWRRYQRHLGPLIAELDHPRGAK